MQPVRNVNPKAVCFMCLALLVAAVVGTAHVHAQGFAPANHQEFENRYAGRKIVRGGVNGIYDYGGYRFRILESYHDVLAGSRFTDVLVLRYLDSTPIPHPLVTLRQGDVGRIVDTGRYTYRRTAPNSGLIIGVFDGGQDRLVNGQLVISEFDRGDACNVEIIFASREHGTLRTLGTGDCVPETVSWRLQGTLPDSEPDFGTRQIDDLQLVENQAIARLTLPEADSGDAPLTYAIQPALPAGLTFNPGNRLLSGTPAAPAARRTYTYTATDADGDSASLTFTITVAAEMTSSVPDFGSRDIGNLRFVRNQAVTPLTLPEADSGDAPLTYEIQPALPAGLTFNSATRVLSGTPTTPAARSTYTYTVTDADDDSASLAFTITVAAEVVEPADPDYVIPLFTSASASQQGFARIINHSDTSGTVRIFGTDDMGKRFPPIDLSLDPKETAHFNSQDLEAGNVSKGLSEGLGDGEGNWRLVLDTGLDIEVSVYIRTIDGFLTSIHDIARTLDDGRHHVPFFNPASNPHQRSELRLINLGDASVQVTIEGRDDEDGQPAGEVRLTLGAGQARLLSAQELESGGSGFSGMLGDGAGKWQLFVTAGGPLEVMSLLQSPTGHLTNLSRSGLRSMGETPTGRVYSNNLDSIAGLDTHGSPAPMISTVAGRTALDPNGDGCYDSGVVFDIPEAVFPITAGLEVSVEFYMNTSRFFSHWLSVGMMATDYRPDAAPVGQDGCTNPRDMFPAGDSYRLFSMGPQRATDRMRVGPGFVDPAVDAQSVEYDQDGWNRLRMEIVSDRRIRIWLNGRELGTVEHSRAQSGYGREGYLWLLGRSASDPVLMDNVQVTGPATGPTGTAAEVTRCDVSISSLTLENVCTPPLEQSGTPESGTVEEVVQRHTDQGYISLPAPLLTYGFLFDTHVPLQLLPVADERRLRELLQERVDEGCEFIARQDAIVTGRFAFVCPSTAPPAPSHDIPLFTSASASQQGFARIINHSDTSGTVEIRGIDDAGDAHGPIDLSLDARETAHFNSQDLEAGSMEKGLPDGLGDGQGNWRLELDTDLDIEVSAYIRTIDGFLTSMHDVARTLGDGRHHVPFFNPGSNPHQRSELRLINLGDENVEVTIEGLDDDGEEPAGEVRLTLGAGEARLLSAEDLETGGPGFSGMLGDGAGKWQLFVTADGPIRVMSLLQSPTGHLTNLSLSGLRRGDSDDGTTRALASHGKFHVIAHDLSELGDHDAECRTQLGGGFRLADWNDIVSYHEDGGSLPDFIAGLKMAPPGRAPQPPDEIGNGYRVSRDGKPIWSGRRHYFFARHDHSKPSHFLAHADIDNHHLSLGSWYGTGGHALCYGVGGSTLRPGETFRDSLTSGGEGPVMVVIPGGSFRMGCLNDDGDCNPSQFPVHAVDVPQFALSKYEVTFAQWDACVAEGGCGGYQPNDRGWGRGNRPVIHVSRDDVQSYVVWLASQTGEDYRLPSESEWEYAARAGTTTKYHWGDDIGLNRASCFGCGSEWDSRSTAPVGSFPANAWGLHDMHGNVWEMVEDCWHQDYSGAPSDGGAWTSGAACTSQRVVRGGSWNYQPYHLRSAYRGSGGGFGSSGSRNSSVHGFRVARTLD